MSDRRKVVSALLESAGWGFLKDLRPPRHDVFDGTLNLEEGTMDFSGNTEITNLPNGLRSKGLNLSGCTGLQSLPDGLIVEGNLVIAGCTGLTNLPDHLKAGVLDMRGCVNIPELPSTISCGAIDLRGCENILIPQSLVDPETGCEMIEFPDCYQVIDDQPTIEPPAP